MISAAHKLSLALARSASAGFAKVPAAQGYPHAITARRAYRLAAVADATESSKHCSQVIAPAELRTRDGIAALAQTVYSAGSKAVGVLVNCVGASTPVPPDAEDEVWHELFAIKPHCSTEPDAGVPVRDAAGRLRAGHKHHRPRRTAAKGTVHLCARGLTCDVAREGVTINCVMPGQINDEQILQRLYATEQSRRDFIERHILAGYFGDAKDIGHASFLVSRKARYVTSAAIPVVGYAPVGHLAAFSSRHPISRTTDL